jgi:two-component system, OmpR family, sensor histidine kinase MprB
VTLRVRLAIASTVAAAVAVIGVAVLGVGFARMELRSSVDETLVEQARGIHAAELVDRQGGRPEGDASTSQGAPAAQGSGDGRSGDGDGDGDGDEAAVLEGGVAAFQVIDESGTIVFTTPFVTPLPIDDEDLEVAIDREPTRLRDATIASTHYRVVTEFSPPNYAVQVARPMTDVDRTLRGLTLGFSVLALLGIAMAGVSGLVLGRRALAPVAELSEASREVAATQDATLTVPETGGAELAQLGRSINTMLASLADARDHERRLIDDAAHELRTPLTSLRTNIEMLADDRPLTADDRRDLLGDVRSQMEEFSSLVGDLDALARGDGATAVNDHDNVSMAAVTEAAVRRAQRRAGTVQLNLTVEQPADTFGDAAMLERAVLNVLDNAVKWSPPDGTVEVRLTGGTITVSDSGPGIAPADLPHVFDRFWRAPTSRSTPGSGLGLAIVKQVVEAHHGTVRIESTEGSGTRVEMTLPGTGSPQQFDDE